LCLLILLPLLSGCAPRSEGTPAPDFELINQSGEVTSLSQLRGRVVMLTFLYTSCPEACPALISKVQQALTRLGDAAADDVALVAITVDPERDTLDRLREYTDRLPADWLYLTGEPGQLKVAWDDYGIYVEQLEPEMAMAGADHAGHPGYEVVHSTKAILIDREGFLRSELTGDWSVGELASQLGLLLSGQQISQGFQPWQSFVDFLVRCGPVTFASFGGVIAHAIFLLMFPIGITIALYKLRWRRSGAQSGDG